MVDRTGRLRSRCVSAALRGRPRPRSKAPRRQGGSFSRYGSVQQHRNPLFVCRGENGDANLRENPRVPVDDERAEGKG